MTHHYEGSAKKVSSSASISVVRAKLESTNTRDRSIKLDIQTQVSSSTNSINALLEASVKSDLTRTTTRKKKNSKIPRCRGPPKIIF